MTFSEKLQFLRMHNGLSQEQVAEKLNVSRQAVSRWELGAIPDMENVIKISNYFDCSLDYLMNDAVDDVNGKVSSVQEYNVKKIIQLKPETVSLITALVAFIAVLTIWIISKIAGTGIYRQDLASGMWFTGFGGFVDHYGLKPVVFLCMIIWELSITARVYIQLFIHRYVLNTKYTVCRVISWGLYLAGTVIGAICICKPWKFMWTSGICIAVVIYLLMIATSLIAATYYGRR